jgi:hypothetical protein
MPADISDAVLDKVKQFTVGFCKAGEKPAAKGSGVLIKQDDMHGILTCAHVVEYLCSLKQPVGLVHFNRGLAQQFGTINMNELNSFTAGKAPWTTESEDIALIHIPAHLVGNISKSCIFLNAEMNFSKSEPDNRSLLIQANSVFGLVEEFTGETTRHDGIATTLLKGVLTSGVVRDFGALITTLECFAANIPELPDNFGGTSGGGLWHVYVRKLENGSFEAVHYQLVGIASQEVRGAPPQITCQGFGRLQLMLEGARRAMKGES